MSKRPRYFVALHSKTFIVYQFLTETVHSLVFCFVALIKYSMSLAETPHVSSRLAFSHSRASSLGLLTILFLENLLWNVAL